MPLGVWTLFVLVDPGDLPLDSSAWWVVGVAAIALTVGLAALASRHAVASPGGSLASAAVMVVISPVVISAFLGWLVWGWINAVRGVARTAPLMYLMPPVAGLVAWAVTGERYTAVKLAGAALTLAGVALAQFTSASARDPVREAPAPVD